MKDIDDVIIPSFELMLETIIDYHGPAGDVDFKYQEVIHIMQH
jgi:hypothetical protein